MAKRPCERSGKIRSKSARAVGRKFAVAVFRHTEHITKRNSKRAAHALAAVSASWLDRETDGPWIIDYFAVPLSDTMPLHEQADRLKSCGITELRYGDYSVQNQAVGSGDTVKRRNTASSKYRELSADGTLETQSFLAFVYDCSVDKLPLPNITDSLNAMALELTGCPLAESWLDNPEPWLELLAEWEQLESRHARYVDSMLGKLLRRLASGEACHDEYMLWYEREQRIKEWVRLKDVDAIRFATDSIRRKQKPLPIVHGKSTTQLPKLDTTHTIFDYKE